MEIFKIIFKALFKLFRLIKSSKSQTKFEKTLDKINNNKKQTFIPSVKNYKGALTDSKFGGIPYLNSDESWPICRNCNKPLNFFLQLNLDKIPASLKGRFGEGIIQLFYCTSSEPCCEVDCESYNPFSKAELVRMISSTQIDTSLDVDSIKVPKELEVFPVKNIDSWQAKVEHPHWEDLTKNEILDMEEIFILDEKEDVLVNYDKDKLSGWPNWIQGHEYPECPICKKEMQFVFQIASEDNIPYMFGDVGTGHITQCPEHKNQLAFGWACS